METPEEEFVSEEETEGSALIKKLRERLKKTVEEKQEYLEGWQRSRAEFANYKKGEVAHANTKASRLKAELIEELLPALDTLELALRHEDTPTLTMLQKQLLDGLKKLGVERFGETGEEFDPGRHEALAKRGEDHLVVSVERSGYAIRSPGQSGEDTIIRPAQVII